MTKLNNDAAGRKQTSVDDLIDETPPVVTRAARAASAPTLRADAVRSEPVRKRRAGSKSEDHFYIPDELQAQLEAQGLSAEFKRVTYMGKEEDPDYHIALAENGWEPLSLNSFPKFKKLMPKSWNKDTFEKRGQILMIRPMELTREAKAEDKKMAEDRVKGHMASLTHTKNGEAPRDNKGQPLVSVKRSYDRGVPVD